MKQIYLILIFTIISLTFSGCINSKNTTPEFEGVYVQTKDNNFIELKSHKNTGNWAIGRQSLLGGRSVRSAIAESQSDFVINQISLNDFKYFITKGVSKIFINIAEEHDINNGYYWISPTKEIDIKKAKDKDVLKLKVDINSKNIYYLRMPKYGHILVKFN